MKRIIILESLENKSTGEITHRVAMWIPVTVPAKRVARPEATSAHSGATAAEITQIRDGSVREEIKAIEVPALMPVAEVKVVLSRAWDSLSAAIANEPFRYQYAGVYYDDNTGWSA